MTESFSPSLFYLDFESSRPTTSDAGDIFLAGVMRGAEFTQVILDQRLEGLATGRSFRLQNPSEFMRSLLDSIHSSSGKLVAYSEAEKNIFEGRKIFLTKGKVNIPYCNLRKAAKKWISKYRRAEFKSLPPLVRGATDFDKRRHKRSLASVMRLTKFHAPKDYAIGKTTSRIYSVIKGLEAKGGDYSRLTRVQKAKATRFLKHNEFDVKSLQILYQTIYKDDPEIIKDSYL